RVPRPARSLLRGLLCPPGSRLGVRGGARDFQGLRLFRGLPWGSLRATRPPFGPFAPAGAAGAADTSNFDVIDDAPSRPELLGDPGAPPELGFHLPFVGY
ncbi:DMPK kinase, partial [Neopipo cinnamomea]|nr:DMPK kinase [Neopipo cinnamomea]